MRPALKSKTERSGKDSNMSRTRLVLTLHCDDYVEIIAEGKSLGVIRLAHNGLLDFARLTFEFAPEIEIVRGAARRKNPRTTQRPERSLKCTDAKLSSCQSHS